MSVLILVKIYQEMRVYTKAELLSERQRSRTLYNFRIPHNNPTNLDSLRTSPFTTQSQLQLRCQSSFWRCG